MLYTPLVSDTADRSPWSDGDATVTTAPGSARPSEDERRPRIAPDCSPWANAGVTDASMRRVKI